MSKAMSRLKRLGWGANLVLVILCNSGTSGDDGESKVRMVARTARVRGHQCCDIRVDAFLRRVVGVRAARVRGCARLCSRVRVRVHATHACGAIVCVHTMEVVSALLIE
eukprot:6173151-Pleurochrysis_carterae.AAC.5